MALPEHLERLKEISIDTLNLTESTQAVLKWHNITSVLDCIEKLSISRHFMHLRDPWPHFLTLLFAEVKPKLIAAGYWDLVLDAEVWRVLEEQLVEPDLRMIVHWQGRDQDLYAIPFEALGLSSCPADVTGYLDSIGACIHHFLYLLDRDAEYRYETHRHKDADWTTQPPQDFMEFMFGVVQPRLVALGLWVFVEAHLDDYVDKDDWEYDSDDEGWEDER